MRAFKYLVALVPFVFVPAAQAQDEIAKMMPSVAYSPQSQAYTYVIKEDGAGSAYLRVDGVVFDKKGGEYMLTLPEGQTGEVSAWYRENGCPIYRGEICIWGGGNSWQVAEVVQDGRGVRVMIPERKVDLRDEKTPLTIGMSYKVGEVTEKKWWGREVAVPSATSSELVQSMSIGVYLPDGVYTRDKQQGPGGWAASMNEMMARDLVAPAPTMADAKMGIAYIDMAGSGQISTYRNNVAPGENYTFRFMSSTAMWKLFSREIGTAAIWVVAIALVLSALMYLLIGKKPWWWYLLVTGLLVVLFVLIGGLWVTYRFGLSSGGGRDYPVMINKTMGVGGGAVEDTGIVPPEITPEK